MNISILEIQYNRSNTVNTLRIIPHHGAAFHDAVIEWCLQLIYKWQEIIMTTSKSFSWQAPGCKMSMWKQSDFMSFTCLDFQISSEKSALTRQAAYLNPSNENKSDVLCGKTELCNRFHVNGFLAEMPLYVFKS